MQLTKLQYNGYVQEQINYWLYSFLNNFLNAHNISTKIVQNYLFQIIYHLYYNTLIPRLLFLAYKKYITLRKLSYFK